MRTILESGCDWHQDGALNVRTGTIIPVIGRFTPFFGYFLSFSISKKPAF